MGMYNYVGHDGEQVKCFYVPAICVDYNKETKEAVVGFHTSGGRLENCNNAPYMTHYYNYGKDFAILKYYLIDDENEPFMHVFRNGKFVETVRISDMPDDCHLNNVIDNYGEWTNIHSVSDAREFIKDYRYYRDMQISMETEALERIGLSYKLASFSEMKEKGADAIRYECQMRAQISNEVYALTTKIFNDKWYDVSHESHLDIIGLALDDYLEDAKRREWRRKEFEWYAIFTQVALMLRENYNEPVEAYYSWATSQGIEVDRDWVRSLFCKYTVPAPEEVVREYEEYLENRGW